MFSTLWPWNGEYINMIVEGMLTGNEEENENRSSPGAKSTKAIEASSRDLVWSVAFLVDEKFIVSSGKEGKIRHWRVEDGNIKEAGPPMDAGVPVMGVAVSRDGRWVVSESNGGEVVVWSAERRSKVNGFKGHSNWVRAIDVSPDGMKIITGSDDRTASVWSLSTGERLVGPLKHDDWVVGAKFSPSGRLVATATWARDLVQVYDAEDGHVVAEYPLAVRVYSAINQSIAWAVGGEQLFALSHDGYVHLLDVPTGTTLFQWFVHSSNDARCIVVASNGTFIATSAGSSVSFWDTATHNQIGSAIECTHDVWSSAET